MVNYTRLRDLLPANENVSIEYRCNAPKCDDEDDMLFGACYWDGKELISEDGDNYYLNDVIEKYEWNDEDWPYNLTVWIEVKWSGEDRIDQYSTPVPNGITFAHVSPTQKYPHGGWFECLNYKI